MSKLINQYNDLKKKDSTKIYAIRIGIFYNFLNEDAKYINEKIGLKITNLSPEIIKCGFPISSLDRYKKIFEKSKINYEIVDNLNQGVSSTDYLNNIEIKHIIEKIKNLDMNNVTFHQAFDILLDFQNKLKKEVEK